MARTKNEKKWMKPRLYLILPGRFDEVVAALKERGLSVAPAGEQGPDRFYLVEDGVGECELTHRSIDVRNPGVEMLVMTPLKRSNEEIVQRVQEVLVRFHSEPDRV